MRLYINGTEDNTRTDSFSIATNDEILSIGGRPFNAQTFLGFMDEVRISDLDRTAEWIATEYSNQKTPASFYGLNGQETPGMTPAGKDMNTTLGSGAATLVFDSTDDEAYWYTDISYPSGSDDASIAAGDYKLNMYFDQLPAAWYDSAWSSRKKLTIDSAMVATDFTTFPVLVSMTDANLIGNTQADGGDLLFTTDNGTTKLDHEIESFNSGTGELVVWVEVQNLAGSSDTDIYMYYDNTGAADQWNINGTWDSNYVAVWHLDESGDGTLNEFNDSTANNNHGTGGKGYNSYVPTQGTGQIGYGQTFDGTNDLIDMASSGWKDSSWPYRKRIIIDGDQVSGSSTLINFPVLISIAPGTDNDLKHTSYGGHVGNLDGTDIFFTNDEGQGWQTGEFSLHHEIEKYDPATGELVAWVEIPDLSPYEDTTLYMYYGYASAPDQQNVSGTWDEGGSGDFKGVWHLKEDPTDTAPQFLDSTSNPNEGTAQPVGQEPSQATGQIDGGLAFDDSNERHVEVAHDTSMQLSTDITVSAWVQTSDNETDVGLIANKWGSVPADRNYWLGKLNDTSIALYVDDTQNVTTNLSLISNGSWHYVVGVADVTNSLLRIYVDGTQRNSAAYDGTSVTGTSDFYIGSGSGSIQQEFDGAIDEVRVSSTARSADWIATEFANQDSPSTFYQVLSEEQPSDVTLDMTGTAITLEAWVKYDAAVSGNLGIMSKNGYSDGYRLVVDDPSHPISFDVTAEGSLGRVDTTGTITSDPDWHHIVGTWDGTTMRVYIDGTVDPTTDPRAGNVDGAGKEFWLGHGDHAIEKAWSYPWDGVLDEVRVSDIGRTAEWIQTEYNNGENQGTGAGKFIKTLGSVESAPTVDIVVSVYHTSSDGSDPQAIVTSSTVTIDGNTSDPYELSIGTGEQQTFTSTDQRLVRVYIDVTAVSGGGSFTLAYDSVADPSSLDTPSMVIPDVTLLLVAVVILIPVVMNLFMKKRRLAMRLASFAISLVAVLGILGQQVLPTSAAPDVFYLHDTVADSTWYDTDWSYRKKITIYASQVSADLNYFPVLINQSSDTELAASAQTDGGDILFTSANGTTKLDHEIERYITATGELVAWVEVPSLSGSVNTELYMYYGNGTVADQWNMNGTWDDNYVVVHHLSDLIDSTQYGNNGTNNGATSTTSGRAGDAYDFDNSTDYIEIADHSTLDLTGNHSADGDTPNPNYYNDYDILASSVDVNNNDWTYLVVTWNGTNRIIYVDGQNRGSDTNNPLIQNNGNPLFIGDSGEVLLDEGYVGIIDEVRVSDYPRTASWVQTSFNNQGTPSSFYGLDSQETPSINPAGNEMNITLGSGAATTIFDSTDDEAYWYTDITYPIGDDEAATTRPASRLELTR
jgi:hypothetical protein